MNVKENINQSTNKLSQRWAKFVIKNKWLVLIAAVLTTFGLASQGKMEFDGDYHAFFSKSNPELEAFDALQEKYTKDDNLIIVLSPKNKDVFTKENLVAIEELTAKAWNTPYWSRVDAITNYQHKRAEEDDLFVEDLSYGSATKTPDEIKEIRRVALS